MPVSISPRRPSSSASGNIYGTSSSSSSTGSSSDSTSRSSLNDRSSSGYKSYLDRAGSLSKLTSSSSSYSPTSYLGSGSYSPRSYPSYRSPGSSLTGGSSGIGTYRSTFSSLGSGGTNSYDTTTFSRYGVNRRYKASDILNNDCKDRVVTKKPPSGSDASGGSVKDSKRLPGSSSSSSLAFLVATSGLDLYEKYSPANYKPNTQLDSGSRSSLNEAGTDLEERRSVVGDITANITLDRPRTNRYSRIYSRNDSDETDNIANNIIDTPIRRSTSGTRPSLSGRLSASNSNTNLNNSDSTEDIPTATFTLRNTRLRKSKVNDEDKKPLRNGTSDSESKKKLNSDAVISNGIDTVAYIKLDKFKISEPKTELENGAITEGPSSITKSGSSSKLRTPSSHETIVPVLEVNNCSRNNRNDDKHDLENNETNKIIFFRSYKILSY